MLQQFKNNNITCFGSQGVRFGSTVVRFTLIAADAFCAEELNDLKTALHAVRDNVEQDEESEPDNQQSKEEESELEAEANSSVKDGEQAYKKHKGNDSG